MKQRSGKPRRAKRHGSPTRRNPRRHIRKRLNSHPPTPCRIVAWDSCTSVGANSSRARANSANTWNSLLRLWMPRKSSGTLRRWRRKLGAFFRRRRRIEPEIWVTTFVLCRRIYEPPNRMGRSWRLLPGPAAACSPCSVCAPGPAEREEGSPHRADPARGGRGREIRSEGERADGGAITRASVELWLLGGQ